MLNNPAAHVYTHTHTHTHRELLAQRAILLLATRPKYSKAQMHTLFHTHPCCFCPDLSRTPSLYNDLKNNPTPWGERQTELELSLNRTVTENETCKLLINKQTKKTNKKKKSHPQN